MPKTLAIELYKFLIGVVIWTIAYLIITYVPVVKPAFICFVGWVGGVLFLAMANEIDKRNKITTRK